MHRKLVATTLVLLVFAGMVSTGTLAVFNDTDDVTANTFTSGSINLTTSPTTAVVSHSSMMPGDRVTNQLVVNNAGSGALRYAISAVATDADGKGLRNQLALTIKSGVTGTNCANFDSTGAVLYTGDLDGTTGRLVGDATQGAQAGDRALSTAANETLCFRAELPTSTTNSFQSATTTATFTFASEQTANNP